MSNQKDKYIMEKENFIALLQRSTPNEIREFLMRKGKRKLISPFIFEDDEKETVNNSKDKI